MSDTTAGAGSTVDPYRAYNFKLVIQGIAEGHFTDCTGLNVRVVAIPYREGGAGNVVRQVPGPVEYGPVTLRYGLTASRDLWDWMNTVVRGAIERKNISILMLDTDGVTEALRWDLINAWPSEWSGSPLDALSKEVAIESMTLVFESMSRA